VEFAMVKPCTGAAKRPLTSNVLPAVFVLEQPLMWNGPNDA